jgi:hypothetical protein
MVVGGWATTQQSIRTSATQQPGQTKNGEHVCTSERTTTICDGDAKCQTWSRSVHGNSIVPPQDGSKLDASRACV